MESRMVSKKKKMEMQIKKSLNFSQEKLRQLQLVKDAKIREFALNLSLHIP